MSNQIETNWEQALLNKVTNNGERLALLERDVSEIKTKVSNVEITTAKIESLLGWLKWIGGGVVAIALSLVANFIYSFFN